MPGPPTLAGSPFSAFRITTRRANKKFRLNSTEIDREVGGRVQAAYGVEVNLTLPERTVFIEVLNRSRTHEVFAAEKSLDVDGLVKAAEEAVFEYP